MKELQQPQPPQQRLRQNRRRQLPRKVARPRPSQVVRSQQLATMLSHPRNVSGARPASGKTMTNFTIKSCMRQSRIMFTNSLLRMRATNSRRKWNTFWIFRCCIAPSTPTTVGKVVSRRLPRTSQPMGKTRPGASLFMLTQKKMAPIGSLRWLARSCALTSWYLDSKHENGVRSFDIILSQGAESMSCCRRCRCTSFQPYPIASSRSGTAGGSCGGQIGQGVKRSSDVGRAPWEVALQRPMRHVWDQAGSGCRLAD